MYHRVKELRKALGMNQQDFARQLGLSQSTLAMIEVGKRNFNQKHVKLVCSAFGVSERWLAQGEGEMFQVSPYEGEFRAIFETLRPETQQYLLIMAREMKTTEERLVSSASDDKDK